ncbi:hypothetical protein BDZ97DRAFT_1345941 [Flammula alnicola]|nr:hypothetical protein BDZ97DRAFT_1345941 [Flammula alnicola]
MPISIPKPKSISIPTSPMPIPMPKSTAPRPRSKCCCCCCSSPTAPGPPVIMIMLSNIRCISISFAHSATALSCCCWCCWSSSCLVAAPPSLLPSVLSFLFSFLFSSTSFSSPSPSPPSPHPPHHHAHPTHLRTGSTFNRHTCDRMLRTRRREDLPKERLHNRVAVIPWFFSCNARRYGSGGTPDDAGTAAETTRCRDTERANEGPPVVATRARWRAVSSLCARAWACAWGGRGWR